MPDRAGQQLGGYCLLRLLGSGGFADVYLAEHLLLKTHVAIKLLHNQLLQKVMESFIDEARTIDSLHHPHIVHVRDFGINPQDNTLFLVMDYAPNGSLRDRHPAGSKLPMETVLSYVKQVADALQHAHDAKRIHRDIKPENMLLGYHNEVILSDFGLAAVAHTTGSLKTQGDAGTIHYMAPEQIQGKPRPASDQYSLAVTVYEWLSGSCPFDGEMPIEIAMKHVMEPPPPLHDKVPTLPQGIVDAVMKGLAKKPEERYASVRDFAEALEEGSKPKATPAVVEVREWVNRPQVKPIGTTLVTYKEHTSIVLSVVWSPDGTRIASGGGGDNSVRVWDATTGQSLLVCKGHADNVWSIAWSPDGTRIASGATNPDNTVRIWDAATGKSSHVCKGHTYGVYSVVWSPDSRRLASAGGKVRVWDTFSGKLLYTHENSSSNVAWSSSGKYLASSSGYDLKVLDASNGKSILTCIGHTNNIESIAWSPTAKQIASVSSDETLRVWDAITGNPLLVCKGHTHIVGSIAWIPNGKLLASASYDNTVRIWDAVTGQCLYVYEQHTGKVNSVAWSPDGTRIASASWDGTVRVWSVGE